MSRWAATDTAPSPAETTMVEKWRVTLTWNQVVDGRREPWSRQRYFPDLQAASAKVAELEGLIAEGWVPVIGATDVEVDGPDQILTKGHQ